MSTPQEIIQQMIDAAPTQAASAEKSILNLDNIIIDLQNKQDAMKTAIADVSSSDLQSYLIGTKFDSETHCILKGETFDQVLDSVGTLTDWKIFEKISLENLIFVSSTEFECDGDQTLIFIEDLEILCDLLIESKTSTVGTSTYDVGTDKTTVIISDEILDSDLSQIWKLVYEYVEGDDTTIDNHITNWNFVHDYIMTPLGLSGTYGTQDTIAKLNDAKGLLLLNKEKYEDSVEIFSHFVP